MGIKDRDVRDALQTLEIEFENMEEQIKEKDEELSELEEKVEALEQQVEEYQSRITELEEALLEAHLTSDAEEEDETVHDSGHTRETGSSTETVE